MLKYGLVALVLIVLVPVALVWWRQERIVFQPPPGPWGPAAEARRVEYRAEDGTALHGWLVGDERSGRAARPLLLVFHGNADLASRQVPWARELAARTGWRVLAAEYRGYEGAGGRPTYAGIALDAHAAWQAARDSLGAQPWDIAIFGHSLGSAVAAELAAALDTAGTPPRALLLQSPFTSVRAMARLAMPRTVLWMWGAIARVHYDTERRVRRLRAVVHVAHGERDAVIPVAMGRAVYDAARVKGTLLVVPDAGHNDVPETGGEAYWRWIDRALGTPAPRAERAATDGGTGREGGTARP